MERFISRLVCRPQIPLRVSETVGYGDNTVEVIAACSRHCGKAFVSSNFLSSNSSFPFRFT